MATKSRIRFTKCNVYSKLSIEVKTNKNIPLPPPISAQEFNREGKFNAEAVMSRNADGSILSRFKDSSWDFSGLAGYTSQSSSMHFNYDEKLSGEVKTILKLLMLTPTSPRPNFGRFLKKYQVVRRIADYCDAERITLKSLINTKGGVRLVKLVKHAIPFYAQDLIIVTQFLHFMQKEGGFEHGYKPLGKDVQSQLSKIASAYAKAAQQTPVIPSQILKKIYHDTISEFEAMQPILDELLEMRLCIDSHPLVGLAHNSQNKRSLKNFDIRCSKVREKYLSNYDLANQFPLAREFLNRVFKTNKKYIQSDSYDFAVMYKRGDILNAIYYIQRVCQDMLIMFTGMRTSEVKLLPYFGSELTVVNGVEYWLIFGFAIKKQSDTPPFEMWVTNEYGYAAFQTAKRIADYFYSRNQRLPLEAIPDKDITPELSPLFLGENGEIANRNNSVMKTPALGKSYPINKDDLNELKMIDPHRRWDAESKFAIGKPFPVELRMFRRSIAFYASASGVRLVDLKNQLHHLFPAQTFYYTQGSGRVIPFLKNKDSFASFFNKVKPEAEAYSFINEVINFDGKLFGASAAYEERNQTLYNTIRNEDRAITIKRFERGELAFQGTHVGGCKTIEPCQSRAFGSVIACLSCNDADINPAKLAREIEDKRQEVNSLNPDRLEFRTEIVDLIYMLNFALKKIESEIESMDRRKKQYKQFSQWRKEFKKMKKKYSKISDEQERVA